MRLLNCLLALYRPPSPCDLGQRRCLSAPTPPADRRSGCCWFSLGLQVAVLRSGQQPGALRQTPAAARAGSVFSAPVLHAPLLRCKTCACRVPGEHGALGDLAVLAHPPFPTRAWGQLATAPSSTESESLCPSPPPVPSFCFCPYPLVCLCPPVSTLSSGTFVKRNLITLRLGLNPLALSSCGL